LYLLESLTHELSPGVVEHAQACGATYGLVLIHTLEPIMFHYLTDVGPNVNVKRWGREGRGVWEVRRDKMLARELCEGAADSLLGIKRHGAGGNGDTLTECQRLGAGILCFAVNATSQNGVGGAK
jgi:hypothetical protein